MDIIFIAIMGAFVVSGVVFAFAVMEVIYSKIRYPNQYEVVIFLLSDGRERGMGEILKECKGKVSKALIPVILQRAVSEEWISVRTEITPWGPRDPEVSPKMFWSMKEEYSKTK